jgi:hypothetical protein
MKKGNTNPIKVCLDDNYAPPNCYRFTIKYENIRVKDLGASDGLQEVNAKFGITRITRTSLLTLYIDSPFGGKDIVAEINNETFQIFIVTQEN